MFGLFKSKKKLQVRNPKADAEFLEAKKKIDDYILLKLKETREHFFFNEVMEILIEYKVVSYENRNKLKIKFLTTLESILTDDEKLLFARYYPFAQFELKVYRYFIKEIETLNILLKLPKDQGIDFLMDFNEQDKEIYKYLRDRDHINKKNDAKYIKSIFEKLKFD